MLIIAKVLDVETREINGKQMADVTMKSGTSVITCTMFDKDVKEGKHKLYTQLQGKPIRVDIQLDEYKGKLQYKFAFGAEPKEMATKPAQAA